MFGSVALAHLNPRSPDGYPTSNTQIVAGRKAVGYEARPSTAPDRPPASSRGCGKILGLPAGFGLVIASLWVAQRGLRRLFRADYPIMDRVQQTGAAMPIQFVGNVIYYSYGGQDLVIRF